MALVLKDRVKEGTTTSGTGTVVLTGAAIGYQSFAVIGNENTTYYTIAGGSDYEVGIGTYYSGNTSLSRDTILASSNANAAVVLSGSYDVFVTYPAEASVYLNGGNSIFANGSSNVSFLAINANVATINTVTLTTGTISTAPNAATDIVNKTYVDSIAATGIHYHTPVLVEAPTALDPVTYNNGTDGVGATLTNAGTQVVLTVDGVALANTNRVLIYTQSNAVQNGIYVVADTGSNSTNWVLTRATDADSYGIAGSDVLGEGSAVFVQSGDTGAGETYVCNTPGVITFGTTDITFVQISSAQIYANGTGLTLSGTTFSISNTAVTAGTYGNASNVATITVNAQGQLTNAVNTAIVVPSSSVTGLGTMATQNATTVAITGGSINGTLIGNATPSNGAFTTLSASGVVSGVGFANFLNAPPTIGGVTANTGAFTSLSAANTLTASANVVISQLTGFLYGNNTSPVTASTTIPNTAITGLGTMSTQNASAVAITGGTINNVSLSNITYGGLGTMATQNANAVAITGGAINGTVLGNTGASTAIFTNMNTTSGNATTFNATSSTITNLISTNAAINGGAINGTLVGNATPSSGAFTTLNASDASVISVNSANAALRVTQTGSGNALLVEDSTNPDATPFVVDANGNVGIGETSPSTYITNGIILKSTSSFSPAVMTWNKTNDNSPPLLAARKDRNGAIVQSGDELYRIFATGYDGANYISAASIIAAVDGTPGTNDMPGRLVFSTTADGASTPTERMRISNSGNVTVDTNVLFVDAVNNRVGVGTTSPASPLTVAGVIQSTSGGVTFPDGTTQTTAASGSPAALNVTLQQSYGGF